MMMQQAEYDMVLRPGLSRINLNPDCSGTHIYLRICLLAFLLCLASPAAAQTSFTYRNQILHPDRHRFFVDASLDEKELRSNAYVFRSLREALLAAEEAQQRQAFSEEHPLTLYIAPSVYWMDNPDDPAVRKPLPGENTPYGMKLKLSHVRLLGLGNRPEEVVLACNRGQTQGAEGNFTMLHLTGDDIQAENLTFGNYCNIDLEYPLNPKLNRKRRADAIVQAQLVICQGDRVVARNCRFLSRLNSCPFAGAKRALFERCYFECTDDALCGTGVYLECRFTLFSGKPFYSTQGTGAVFLNCDLHSLTRGRQYLVKVGSPVALVDCRWTGEDPALFIGWTQDPTDDLRCYQYNLTLNGQPLLIQADKPWLTVDMTGKPVLEAYKLPARHSSASEDATPLIYNVYNLLRGIDDWNPLRQKALCGEQDKPTLLCLSHRNATLESGVDSLLLHSRLLRFSTEADFHRPATEKTHIRWSLSPQDSAYATLSADGNGNCLICGTNREEEPRTVSVIATTDSGLEAACVVTVLPRRLPAPEFIRKPVIRIEKNRLTADYLLRLGRRADHSLITWYRCTSPRGEGTIPVAVSRLNRPKRHYTLTPSDSGYYLKVTVAPKHLRSLPGEAMSAIIQAPVSCPAKERTLTTDFTDFPTDYQPRILPGFWTVDAYKPADTRSFAWQPDTARCWSYGRGVDGAAHATGLLQAGRGARLLYTPLPETYKDMAVTLTVDPCKSAGQGFGSATGQYMDVYIKFDTKSLSGYALRIIRTTKNDKAVDFLLMRYDNGTATPITEPVSSICYRTGCRIQLKIEGSRFTAHVETSTPLPALHRPGLTTTVDLEATVPPNPFGGTGIQHTGSTGASATLLRHLTVAWW